MLLENIGVRVWATYGQENMFLFVERNQHGRYFIYFFKFKMNGTKCETDTILETGIHMILTKRN